MFFKKSCSWTFRKFHRKTPLPKACNFIKKETLALVFSSEFCKISKNTFYTEHLQITASVISYWQESTFSITVTDLKSVAFLVHEIVSSSKKRVWFEKLWLCGIFKIELFIQYSSNVLAILASWDWILSSLTRVILEHILTYPKFLVLERYQIFC